QEALMVGNLTVERRGEKARSRAAMAHHRHSRFPKHLAHSFGAISRQSRECDLRPKVVDNYVGTIHSVEVGELRFSLHSTNDPDTATPQDSDIDWQFVDFTQVA